MATRLESRSDCTRCAALCCIAYPSEDMPGFAAAKEAGQPCPKLGDDARNPLWIKNVHGVGYRFGAPSTNAA